VSTPSAPAPGTRKRLDHIDAMRPIKQAAVISTHALIFFAPVGAGMLTIDGLVLTHFSREAFLFVSACMLAFSLRDGDRIDLKKYWKRRFMSVGVPYLTWTLIYFLFIQLIAVNKFPYYSINWAHTFTLSSLHHLWSLTWQGYYHLYYLLVILEFYALFPLLLKLIRRWDTKHVHIMVGALLWQILFSVAVSRHWIAFMHPGFWQTRFVLSYLLYLVGGIVVALHLDDVHQWIVGHAWFIRIATVLSAVGAILLNNVHAGGIYGQLIRPGGNPFAVLAIPYTVGAILCVYLLGVFLVSPKRSIRTRAATKSGSDNSYGIYLSQMIWIPILLRIWQHYNISMPFPLGPVAAVVVVYSIGFLFTAVFARTPLARAVTGRSQVPWSTFWPRRRVIQTPLDADAADGPLDLVE